MRTEAALLHKPGKKLLMPRANASLSLICILRREGFRCHFVQFIFVKGNFVLFHRFAPCAMGLLRLSRFQYSRCQDYQ
jgi:hypothetical protein